MLVGFLSSLWQPDMLLLLLIGDCVLCFLLFFCVKLVHQIHGSDHWVL